MNSRDFFSSASFVFHFFPESQVVSLYTCADEYYPEISTGIFCNFCSFLLSLLCPTKSRSLVLPALSALFFQLRDTSLSLLDPSSMCYTLEILSSRLAEVLQDLFAFPSLSNHSPVLPDVQCPKTISPPYILPAFQFLQVGG